MWTLCETTCEHYANRHANIMQNNMRILCKMICGQYAKRHVDNMRNDIGHYAKQHTGPSTSTLIRLYKSYIHSLFDYDAPATCVASPHVQRIWEGVQTHFITRALSIPCFIHNDRKRQHAYLPPIHDRNLYLAKHWYRRAMLHNSGVQDYIDNHTHNKHTHTGSCNTPLKLIRN